MTLNWDRGLWHQMSQHAFLGTAAGLRSIILAVVLGFAGIPLGLAFRAWATRAWDLYYVPGMRLATFLAGFLSMLVIALGVAAGGWGHCNEHIGRIEQQSAQVDHGWLTFCFKFKAKGLPDARHIVQVRLDPSVTQIRYDADLRLVTFVSPGTAQSIWHGYTRNFSTSGPVSELEPQLLAEYTVPDDFEPSLLQSVLPYFKQ